MDDLQARIFEAEYVRGVLPGLAAEYVGFCWHRSESRSDFSVDSFFAALRCDKPQLFEVKVVSNRPKVVVDRYGRRQVIQPKQGKGEKMGRLAGKFQPKPGGVESPESANVRLTANITSLESAIRKDGVESGRALAKAVMDAIAELRPAACQRAVEIVVGSMGKGIIVSEDRRREIANEAKTAARAKLEKARDALKGALGQVESEVDQWTQFNAPRIDPEKVAAARAAKLSGLDLEGKLVRVKHASDFLDKGNIGRLLDTGDAAIAYAVLDSSVADAHLKARAVAIVESHLTDPTVAAWQAIGTAVDSERGELVGLWRNLSTAPEALAASDMALSGKYQV